MSLVDLFQYVCHTYEKEKFVHGDNYTQMGDKMKQHKEQLTMWLYVSKRKKEQELPLEL